MSVFRAPFALALLCASGLVRAQDAVLQNYYVGAGGAGIGVLGTMGQALAMALTMGFVAWVIVGEFRAFAKKRSDGGALLMTMIRASVLVLMAGSIVTAVLA